MIRPRGHAAFTQFQHQPEHQFVITVNRPMKTQTDIVILFFKNIEMLAQTFSLIQFSIQIGIGYRRQWRENMNAGGVQAAQFRQPIRTRQYDPICSGCRR